MRLVKKRISKRRRTQRLVDPIEYARGRAEVAPASAARGHKLRGTSKSSQYRQIDKDPTLRRLKELLPRIGATRTTTEAGYRRALEWMGATAEELERASQHNSMIAKRLRAMVATASKQRKSAERRQRAETLLGQGVKKKDIARELGITRQGLRKLLNRP